MMNTPMTQNLGKGLIIIGIICILIGLLLIFKDRIPGLSRLGHLPGDIVIKQENVQFYFPLMTSILLSLFLTLIFWLFRK